MSRNNFQEEINAIDNATAKENALLREKEEEDLKKTIEESLKEEREKEAREKEAREKELREKEAREKEAREREAREKEARKIKTGASSAFGSNVTGTSGLSSSFVSSSKHLLDLQNSNIKDNAYYLLTQLNNPIIPYINKLDYLKINQPLLKIPIFAHYNNLSFYTGQDMVNACSFSFNNENIYLVRQYILTKDIEDINIVNLEFRPNAFYMKQIPKWEHGNHLMFTGTLTIFNLTEKTIIHKVVKVHSHDGTFSPNQNLLSFNELTIQPDVDETFYYIEFIPDISTIKSPSESVIPRTPINYPIFRGFYCLKKMGEQIAGVNCLEMEKKFSKFIEPIAKGGGYSNTKRKQKTINKKKINKKNTKKKTNKKKKTNNRN